MTHIRSCLRRFGAPSMGRAWLALALAVFAIVAPGAAPEPDPVPRRWQLEYSDSGLRFIRLEVPGVGSRPFFYMTYSVVNNSGSDVLFAPAFDLATSDGQVVRSGRGIPSEVTRALLERAQNPLVKDQIQVLGPLLQGPENARDGLVIWPAPDLDVAELTVFTSGLSGETAAVRPPGAKSATVLRKTLMVRYSPPGDMVGYRSAEPLPKVETRWIMR